MPITHETVLEMLWLASGPWALDLAGGAVPEPPPKLPDIVLPDIDEDPSNRLPERAISPPAPTISPPASETQLGYAPISAAQGEESVAASPVTLPAARTLAQRLPLTRALRPFRQPFLSQRARELDEEATAELTAELQAAGLAGIFPVERPERERWFDVHVVLEDDPAAALWEAPLYEFARVLQQSGAFRLIRTWRLRLDRGAPLDIHRAELRPLQQGLDGATEHGGDRRVPGQIGVDRRQLILFASHGASMHWLDGSYARLLLGWSSAAVALLDLLPPDRQAQTALGEPHGIGWAPQAGAPAAAFQTQVMWWRTEADPESPDVVRLPMTSLDPTTLGNWALAQMARGRRSAIYLLDTTERMEAAAVHADTLSAIDVERRLALLRERSDAAYELAIALSVGPFTLPVARVVQEVLFGSATDTTLLADLLLSGIVAMDPPAPDARSDELVFRVAEHARALLSRALRADDRGRLIEELQDRIGAHLGKKAPGGFSFTVLFRDPEGSAKLPAWVHGFMRFASPLVRSIRPGEAGPDAAEIVRWMDDRRKGQLYRLLTRGSPLSEQTVRPDIWHWLRADNLLVLSDAGDWAARPDLLQPLEEATGMDSLFGLRLLWVDDRPSNNRSILEGLRARGLSIETALSTEEAMARSDLEFVDVVISDMARPPDGEAGLGLIGALRARDLIVPVIIYAGLSAADPKNQRRVHEAGGFASTNDGDVLVRLINDGAYAFLEGWGLGAATASTPGASLASVRQSIVSQILAHYLPAVSPSGSAATDPLAVERTRLLSLIRSRAGGGVAAEPPPAPSAPPATRRGDPPDPARLHFAVDPLVEQDAEVVSQILQFCLLAADSAERRRRSTSPDNGGEAKSGDGLPTYGSWYEAFSEIPGRLGWSQVTSYTFGGLATKDEGPDVLILEMMRGGRFGDAIPALRRLIGDWQQVTGADEQTRLFPGFQWTPIDNVQYRRMLQVAALTQSNEGPELKLSIFTTFATEIERRGLLFVRLSPRLHVDSHLLSLTTTRDRISEIVPSIRDRLGSVSQRPVIGRLPYP